MTILPPDPLFKPIGIRTFSQHGFIIIGLYELHPRYLCIPPGLLWYDAGICHKKDSVIAVDDEIPGGAGRVMGGSEGCHFKGAYA